MSFIFLHFFILIVVFCYILFTKNFKNIRYTLTEEESIILYENDKKRQYVLQNIINRSKELEDSKEIVSDKSFKLLNYMFLTLSGLLFTQFLSIQYENTPWLLKNAIPYISTFIFALILFASYLLLLPRKWQSDFPTTAQCFSILWIDKLDFKSVELQQIEKLENTISINAKIHNIRVQNLKILYWLFVTSFLTIPIIYLFCHYLYYYFLC